MRIKLNVAVFDGLILCSALALAGQTAPTSKFATPKKDVAVAKLKISAEGQACLDCHTGSTPVLVQQWHTSEHARQGVDCYSCHKANADDPAAFDHYGQKIAVIVTPTVHNRAIAYRVARMDKAKPSPAALAAPSAPQMP